MNGDGFEGLDGLERWRASGRMMPHRGHPIFLQIAERDASAREALVCIHGFPTASWDWRRQWPDFTARFDRVIAPDMIGFGFSAKPRAYGYSILDQADLHEALLAGLGVRRVHIVAHDYGDTVAQELIARFEDRRRSGAQGLDLASVVLLNGGLFPETHRPEAIQKALAGPLGFLVARGATEARFKAGFPRIFGEHTRPDAAELDALWRLISTGRGQHLSHKLIGYMAERRRHRERWVGALQTTQVPLRVIDGLADPISGAHMLPRYRELVPAPDTVGLEGIGHYPQTEAPDAVTAAIREFQTRSR